MAKQALIIGAGPAGLTVAYELLTRTDYQVCILEASQEIGGISRTINYKGNRMDIGGHRFFSKSDRVMDFWLDMLPLGDPEQTDGVMMERSRLSRILYLRMFFDYPITLSAATLRNLGLARVWKIGWSYIRARLFPRKEVTLEDFYVNRFGRQLYETFFMDYTEKVWGVPCSQITAEWGAQRVKGLSISKTILHAVRSLLGTKRDRKQMETSLIDRFYYPKHGPGQLWEAVRDRVAAKGGEVRLGERVTHITVEGGRATQVRALDASDNETTYTPDIVFSTMPISELITAIDDAPSGVQEVAGTLPYRDFMTMGLLLNTMRLQDKNGDVRDNWIYIQENDVKIGRLQLFHNWSPYMVAKAENCFLGLEYFCNAGDLLWNMPDEQFAELALAELCKLDIIRREDVLDWTIVRQPKAYPAYFGSYARFDDIRAYLDGIENLIPLGRNGMHRYNNMDHSMLTAMVAVDNIVAGRSDRGNLWEVNAEQEYHEKK